MALPSASSRATLPPTLPAEVSTHQLDNGLRLVLLRRPGAGLVATGLCYTVGTRDETTAEGGAAHFLEHMMFKGSRAFGAGEIDRLTQALGGSNNAFTGHDATVYHFQFAADRWLKALDIEADRMQWLALEALEVDHERQVILEEITLYQNDPWEALDAAVRKRLFPDSPYGLPILGERDSLQALGSDELRSFHQRHYRPGRAVLAIAGDIDPAAVLAEVASRFEGLEAGPPVARPAPAAISKPQGVERVEIRRGRLARLMVALPGPKADDPDHTLLRLLLVALAGGRSGLLSRSLVEEGQWATWVSADIAEHQGQGALFFTLEPALDVEPSRLEAELLALMDRAATTPPTRHELERGRSMLTADWVFDHERVFQIALAAAQGEALFGLDFLDTYLKRIRSATAEELARVAAQYLRPATSSVIGWVLPEGTRPS